MTDYEKIHAAAAFIRDRAGSAFDGNASVGIVLGSGLGHVGDALMDAGGVAIDYAAIPHFPTSSVVGHKGRLVIGKKDDVTLLVMQGRVHRYEGYPANEVIFPVRVLTALGIKRLVLTNAAGGLQDGMIPGELMLIEDHLNLTGDHPLVGKNDDRLGPRFPDMSHTYDPKLRQLAIEVAAEIGVGLKHGVYAGLLGPTYETPAEIRMLRTLGADAVGMSTVYEAIAAAHGGIPVVGISCITNLAAGISSVKLSHDEVKETADQVAQQFSALVLTLGPRLLKAALHE